MSIKDNITEGISKIAKTVGEGANTVAKRSEEFVEISKLSLNISSEKANVEELYKEIGKLILEKYANGEIIDKNLEANCKLIDEAKGKIKKYEEKIEKIRNEKKEAEIENEDVTNCEGSSCNFTKIEDEEDLIK